MKKILIIGISLCLFLISCENRPLGVDHPERSQTAYTSVKELTIDNITHEYVLYSCNAYGVGMTHYPECKYCKNKK